MALYSEKVMDHFLHPRNVGVLEDADGVGEVGNAKCGDIMKIYLKIDNDVISDVKFETFGCGSAIASSSMATEMIKGKPVSEALQLTNKAVAEALDGLPAHKLHCSVLAEEAIKSALKDYYDKNGIGEPMKVCRKPSTGVETKAYAPQASDDFEAKELGLQWQFNHNPHDEYWSLTEKPGLAGHQIAKGREAAHGLQPVYAKDHGIQRRGHRKNRLRRN